LDARDGAWKGPGRLEGSGRLWLPLQPGPCRGSYRCDVGSVFLWSGRWDVATTASMQAAWMALQTPEPVVTPTSVQLVTSSMVGRPPRPDRRQYLPNLATRVSVKGASVRRIPVKAVSGKRVRSQTPQHGPAKAVRAERWSVPKAHSRLLVASRLTPRPWRLLSTPRERRGRTTAMRFFSKARIRSSAKSQRE